MLSKVALDPNPEMKQKAAAFAGEICVALKEKVGHYMKNTVISLVKNLGHQHSKVRKATLIGMRDVLVTRGAEPFIEDALTQLKFAMNDRSIDVRQTFYSQVMPKWITEMDINSLKLFDSSFVLFLLNGLSDES